MKVGIVGHEATKFSDIARDAAIFEIGRIIGRAAGAGIPTVVSGACHLGGIDQWAENAADHLGCPKLIHKPTAHHWPAYKTRNLLIARDSDEVHVIVVDVLPAGFKGITHELCYHCQTSDHVKSGGCWTARQAMKMDKPAIWHVISQETGQVTIKTG